MPIKLTLSGFAETARFLRRLQHHIQQTNTGEVHHDHVAQFSIRPESVSMEALQDVDNFNRRLLRTVLDRQKAEQDRAFEMLKGKPMPPPEETETASTVRSLFNTARLESQ